MKNSLCYRLIFLLFASVGQQAHAMKWANGFRLGMKAINYAGTLALPVYLLNNVDIVKRQINEVANSPTQPALNIASDSSVETEKYILNILRTAYPELKNTPIKVVNLRCKAWATCPHNGMHYFATPLTDKELQTASSEILSKINVIIRHEGAHILHNDRRNVDLIALVAPAAVLCGLEKMKAALGLSSLFSQSPIAGNIIKGLGYIPSLPLKIIASLGIWHAFLYWREYQADQEAIKRTQDPNELRIMSSTFSNMPTHEPSTLKEKIVSLMDPHPNKDTRAKYFAEAAQKLETKQAQELTQNGAGHD